MRATQNTVSNNHNVNIERQGLPSLDFKMMPEIRTQSKQKHGRNRGLQQNDGGRLSRLKQALEKRMLEPLSSSDYDSNEYQTVNLYDLEAFTRQLLADKRKRRCLLICRVLGALCCTVLLIIAAAYLRILFMSDKLTSRHYNMSLPLTLTTVEEKPYVLLNEHEGGTRIQ
jgi:hypothetical protein